MTESVSQISCNLCGSTIFRDMKQRKRVRCADCGSLERTRLLWLYLERSGILRQGTSVLHLAPELGLSRQICKTVGADSYRAVDYNPEIYSKVPNVKPFDLTSDAEKLKSESLDLIVHIHVIEHIPCNIAYPLYHLHRALKSGGLHACIIPVSPGKWDESFDCNLSDKERIRRFGQHDHLRRIGRADIDQTLGKILDIKSYYDYDATRDFSIEMLRSYNIPKTHWYGLGMGTPLMLRKDDYLLK